MILKSMLIWSSFVPLGILNGGLRIYIIEPLIGTKYANPISCIILAFLVFIVSCVFIPRLGKNTTKTYLLMGLLWLFLTIIFETIFGLLTGNTFDEIISAYNITTGNFWIIDVVFIGFVPFLIAKLKRLHL